MVLKTIYHNMNILSMRKKSQKIDKSVEMYICRLQQNRIAYSKCGESLIYFALERKVFESENGGMKLWLIWQEQWKERHSV